MLPPDVTVYSLHEKYTDNCTEFLVITPESRLSPLLQQWASGDIVAQDSPARYEIMTDTSPTGRKGEYRIILLPRPDSIPVDKFVHENWQIYWMIHLLDADEDLHPAIRSRSQALCTWAKEHGVLGGAYPDTTCYILFSINTVQKGYEDTQLAQLLSHRCMYFHRENKYRHISHVGQKALRHVQDLYQGRKREYPYTYRLSCNDRQALLPAVGSYIDSLPCNAWVSDGAILHSEKDVSSYLQSWPEKLKTHGLKVTID